MIWQNHCFLVISILKRDATGHAAVELTVTRLLYVSKTNAVLWKCTMTATILVQKCSSEWSFQHIKSINMNVNDYRCCNIWIVHRLEVTYRRNQMHHWAGWCCACSPQFHTTKPSTVAILISLPMMISNDHSSCIFINVHTGDHSQLCRKL